MKTRHIALPGLQIAAAAFFAAAAEAKVYCTDSAGAVVAQANCDGARPAGTFFLAEHEGDDLQLGNAIAEDRIDAADPIARKAEGYPESGLVNGGFGRRSPQKQCDPSRENCAGKGGNNGG
ncbi:hypothetical protein ColTof4_04635 [Colletotrichum tofieldiae]|uniref:DUF4124 domain-containing protein n=1 Tax=Colletotrichum tofieldiae TaxID=708197 RepID=A0A166NM83_9PEZI|nr:hypothetical protein CT0861_10374 [Colletotrichum tofieldiae]GKT63784.1 hypothetical protein ColTof3_11123 [Colletotrichum tofieldiae]GKT72212.1 hypothetical protein ColTof4_04635 [Colletotrichum tofieldiae]GKT89977.1 hypothetical protein Ct61P_07827 [Colletotrichum tofieldiae]